MDLGIKGKTIAVTGAGGGIGRSTAEMLAAEGARLALMDLNQEGLSETFQRIKGSGGKAGSYPLDITDHNACQTTIAKIASEMGPLCGLCNVAGVLVGTPFAQSAPENWQAELEVCLKGTMNMCHAAMGALGQQEYGKIVNVASDAARIGEPSMVAYSAAKGGVVSFSKSLAKLLGRQRTNVNVVAPGTTRTAMISFLTPEMEQKWLKMYPLRRLGEPSDIAAAICFLASQQANWITGQVLSVNGGYSMA